MALTKEDLQAIADLMDSKIQASETRMLNRMDQVVRESDGCQNWSIGAEIEGIY